MGFGDRGGRGRYLCLLCFKLHFLFGCTRNTIIFSHDIFIRTIPSLSLQVLHGNKGHILFWFVVGLELEPRFKTWLNDGSKIFATYLICMFLPLYVCMYVFVSCLIR